MENTSSSLTKDGLIKMIGLINGKVGTFRFIDGPEDWSNTSANVDKSKSVNFRMSCVTFVNTQLPLLRTYLNEANHEHAAES